MVDVRLDDLHSCLVDPVLSSMNFLNEIALRYPEAISFAAGRPYEENYDLDALPRYLRRFRDHLADDLGYGPDRVRSTIVQYGRTKGIISDLVARHLATDEGIMVPPESIVVTVGCQEAMFLVLRALRRDERDVLLAVSPTYSGIGGAARLADIPVVGVHGGGTGIDFDDLAVVIEKCRAGGARPRAMYVVPDFANPTGISLSPADRRGLLDVARAEDFLVLEDNPYGLFHGAAPKATTLKAIDEHRRVIYLGSFSKTALPGVRVGFVVADQVVSDGALFADHLARIKSMVTVNTSPVAQAVAGGKLLEHGCSLVEANSREREIYRRNLDTLLAGLAARIRPDSDIRWNSPTGGFFAIVSVPFTVDDDLLERSARDFGVLWTPMHLFYDGPGGEHHLRLSISAVTPAEIDNGLDRLTALFRAVLAE